MNECSKTKGRRLISQTSNLFMDLTKMNKYGSNHIKKIEIKVGGLILADNSLRTKIDGKVELGPRLEEFLRFETIRHQTQHLRKT